MATKQQDTRSITVKSTAGVMRISQTQLCTMVSVDIATVYFLFFYSVVIVTGSSSRSGNGCGCRLDSARFSGISQLLSSSTSSLSLVAGEQIPLVFKLWFDRTSSVVGPLGLMLLWSPSEYSVLRSRAASPDEAATDSATFESDGASEGEASTSLSGPFLLFFNACKMNRGVKFFEIQSALLLNGTNVTQ